jgi:S-adenosylmethionine synthetase
MPAMSCRNIVANGLAHKCQLQLSYAIGEPRANICLCTELRHIQVFSDDELQEIVLKNFDFSVSNIIKELNLRQPIYKKTVNYGHFGKKDLPWEQFKKINY